MVAIYALGHVSGAHFNPAVTAAFAAGRHFPIERVLPYWSAQGCGAIAAAGLLRLSLGSGPLGVTRPARSDLQAFAWETVLTFILMLVIVAVATDTRAIGQAAAIAIGGAVALGSLVGGPISGASMNPARSIGPAIIAGDLSSLWVYLTAPFVVPSWPFCSIGGLGPPESAPGEGPARSEPPGRASAATPTTAAGARRDGALARCQVDQRRRAGRFRCPDDRAMHSVSD